jgi:hypothetical protein
VLTAWAIPALRSSISIAPMPRVRFLERQLPAPTCDVGRFNLGAGLGEVHHEQFAGSRFVCGCS